MTGLISLIDAVAWPAAMLTIAILFRHEVRGVLARLGEFKYAGLEMNFRENLHDAEILARAVPRADPALDAAQSARVRLEVVAGDTTELAGTLVGREAPGATTILVATPNQIPQQPARSAAALLQICGESPREGVLTTWAELRQGLLAAATHLGDRRAPAPVRVEGATRFLVERGWLNGVEGQLIERLHVLADHVESRDGPPPALAEAHRFVDLAVPLMQRVDGLHGSG